MAQWMRWAHRSIGHLALACLAGLSLPALSAPAASASSMTTDCAHLQAALNQVADGNTITLTQLCTADNSGASAGAFTIPTANALSFTLTGQAGSGAGFDGTGVSQSMLSGGFTLNPINLTISHLTFKNGTAGTSGFGGGAIFLQGHYDFALDHDTFTDNGASSTFNGGGAVEVFGGGTTGSFSITHSRFSRNVAAIEGGAVEIDEANGQNGQIPITLSHDTFSRNSVQGGAGSQNLRGGALSIGNESEGVATVTQTGNRFSGNYISGGTAGANGGAEAMFGMNLNSTGDVFWGNSLRAAPIGQDSEGSALSIENNDCNNTSNLVLDQEATNLVMAGNSVEDGGDTTGAHGALYVGCAGAVGGNDLTLNDSTISGNKGGGGTAGIFGDPTDNLTLRNSILAGNSGRAQLTGFSGGGVVTVTHTDLCSGSSPFTGTGNICAAPKLISAQAGNVRETFSSPTINKGLNSLVPAGVTKDAYGLARIQARLNGGAPRVDMGAAEFQTVGPPLVKITKPAAGSVFKRGQVVHSSFTCTEAPHGPGIASCKDGTGHPSGGPVNTSTTGQHIYKVTATSKDGLKTTKTVTYTVKK